MFQIFNFAVSSSRKDVLARSVESKGLLDDGLRTTV
jgi:hypothetical protein